MTGTGRQISHDERNNRYIINVDGVEAGYAAYAVETSDHGTPTVRDLNHTVIDPRFRGRGLSAPLIRFALEDTREAGLAYRATCSAVEHFIAKNPDYAEGLVKGAQRTR
ncbi:GNAT family N-acetyltransferase [Corynebacterium pygosceleis]|uniref:GNAT family N-acetyltransferase n=1 Tax=Corynebacterium pygosceleis TaxID=2800406 RepID=A0ABT3WT66_9CORY|nr:GNAT family N-acetyltransferase [Corynebacterium pygosceleis]MCK7675479.1 N-acetyltransferase [Corynebacterium pygosceleis]MCL0121127.1 N-acetyltransferase [Corynebacterium pygosceleis]MCX7445341.1 GNAT family N-acetyltransferase [Corynebacterium pygosceleis]